MRAEIALDEPSDGALDGALSFFRAHGYARLGKLVPDALLEQLRQRVDDILLGTVTYEGLFFQHDGETGRYEDLVYKQGYVGPSLDYRKVEKLEKDPLFFSYMTAPLFGRVARAVYGVETITLYRALLFLKSARGGSFLPWHQDGGTFWGLDREPSLQLWTTFDDAKEDGGCLEVVPGSHHGGLVTPLGGVVPAEHVARREPERSSILLPAVAGEVIVVHNHLWHRSGRNHSGHPRRAFTACYMHGDTRCRRTRRAPREFVKLFPREERSP